MESLYLLSYTGLHWTSLAGYVVSLIVWFSVVYLGKLPPVDISDALTVCYHKTIL